MLSSPILSCQVTPKIGTKLGSTVKILLRLMRILCRVIVPNNARPPSHPKDWNQTWFYCKDTSPADENPLPGYRSKWLNPKHHLPEQLATAERSNLEPTISKVKALLGNGLTGIDLVWRWVSWRIIPLSRRSSLMCTYMGDAKYALRYSSTRLTDDAINEITKTLLNENLESCNKVGLNPFCTLNLPPTMSLQIIYFTLSFKCSINSTLMTFIG